ncbi:MAG: hypothetical protein HEQ20_03450 [Aphanizomenon flos-aquae KM1D3_PB]|uniref:hypothetical protein n=1 Tax=Aphanizomenon flos-aquae TaxID=1176 RepID=UPI001363A5A0|nr:hypothetical protein [Aphanizomenon flos-aquae]QSV69982.1 MAG: hypothetical protein HEQ20_03450 [Aphanizomenon flos-aquae KM1D3_PB]
MKRVWAILHFFTQFGFIVFTYLLISIKRNRKQLISCQKQDAEFPHQELNGI